MSSVRFWQAFGVSHVMGKGVGYCSVVTHYPKYLAVTVGLTSAKWQGLTKSFCLKFRAPKFC